MRRLGDYRGLLQVGPVVVGVGCACWLAWNYYRGTPSVVDFANIDRLSDADKAAIDMAKEPNKYLASFASLLTAALGYYTTKLPKRGPWLTVALVLCLALVSLTLLFGYLSYAELTSELAQSALALLPGRSRVLFFLEMEFWAFLGSALTLGAIFIFAHPGPNQQDYDLWLDDS